MTWAEAEAISTGKSARRFVDFRWATKRSWTRRRRVVTSLKVKTFKARDLYERLYCARRHGEED